MINTSNIVAIRSLACEDHGYNIIPNVLCVSWFIGKRCNYDCSYCGPHFHDAVSPFINTEVAYRFIDKINQWASNNNKKIKWSLTGGEPFIDPNILPMLQTLSNSNVTEQINVISNGSLPYATYMEALQYLAGITISLHLERSQNEIDATITKLVKLKKNTNKHIGVNLMFLPGSKQQVLDIIAQLTAAGIPTVVRKITPLLITEEQTPFTEITLRRKDQQLLNLDRQTERKNVWYSYQDQQRSTAIDKYYSKEDHDFVAEINQRSIWHNTGVWEKDNYRELNSDLLIAQNQNSFMNWICYAGVDNLYIDFDGSIYRATCLNDGPIGHIENGTTFLAEPTVCKKQWCLCTTDIPIRKASDREHHKLIS